MATTTMQTLISSLRERWTPEMVMKTILEGEVELTTTEKHTISSALGRANRYSLMATKFAETAGLDRQLKVAEDLFPAVKRPKVITAESLGEYLVAMRDSIRMEGNDFKANRLAHAARKSTRGRKGEAKTMPNGHRAYNKRFRFLARMSQHVSTRTETAEMRELAQIAKSRLSFKLDRSVLTNLKTVCFVAYMTSKLNKRSTFTFEAQENPYDSIAAMLYARLGKGTNWLAVAYVHPEPGVLKMLDDRQKGILLGVWFSVMTRAAKVLDREVKGGDIDLKELVVRRGNDSSTWNEAAGAFNKARDGWVNTLYALGMEEALDAFVPGKALRLMAADVVWGHRHYGSGLDPNTAVWGELPKPWEVILHKATCTRAMVEAACSKHNCTAGWLAPKTKSVAKYVPTPELVHGVIVSSPELAQSLKAAGYFGGPSKGPVKALVPHTKTMEGLTVKVSGSPSIDEMFGRV